MTSTGSSSHDCHAPVYFNGRLREGIDMHFNMAEYILIIVIVFHWKNQFSDMCYIKMFYLQMKQVKKEIIRNSRSMTMPNLYVDHQKSKLKLIKMFCVDCRGHVLNILPSENA